MNHRSPPGACDAADPLSVLVVEDEPLIRFVAVEYLEEDGFRVVEADSAREALALLQAGDIPVDLVFSDIQMPGGFDGCDLARWIRENRPGLPVVLTSSRVHDDALPDELRQLAPIVSKPYRSDRLMHRVRAALCR